VILAALLAAALPAAAAAADVPAPVEVSTAPAASFTSFELPNGLRVLLVPDRSVPVVTLATIFEVGGRQEVRGRSGFAHLFEHLMFEGSAHVPKGRFDRLLESRGADNNASTHEDFTFYYEVLPSNALPLAVWLDADRLSALDVSAESLRTQVSVVKEEKRMRVDNEAYAPLLWVEIASRTFSNFTNAHPVIGSFEDLEAATLKDVRGFFQDYYAPKNAWMAVVGDFDPAAVKRLLERYFAWIPNRGEPVFPDDDEPRQERERVHSVADPHAQVPGVALVWNNLPARRAQPDYYALGLLGRLLFQGKSARLYQLLVKERKVAVSIEGGGLGFPLSDPEEYKAPGLFGGFVLHKAEAKASEVRDLVYAEVERIASAGVSEEELERVKTKFRSDWVLERETSRGRAAALLRAAVLDGDPAAAQGELERFMAVTPADVRAAAAKYLVRGAANVFELKLAEARK
jgi:predicted Zn-dependent peptidase